MNSETIINFLAPQGLHPGDQISDREYGFFNDAYFTRVFLYKLMAAQVRDGYRRSDGTFIYRKEKQDCDNACRHALEIGSQVFNSQPTRSEGEVAGFRLIYLTNPEDQETKHVIPYWITAKDDAPIVRFVEPQMCVVVQLTKEQIYSCA